MLYQPRKRFLKESYPDLHTKAVRLMRLKSLDLIRTSGSGFNIVDATCSARIRRLYRLASDRNLDKV